MPLILRNFRKRLGWSPIPEFCDGLEKTVDWYLSNTKWLERILSGDYGNITINVFGKIIISSF